MKRVVLLLAIILTFLVNFDFVSAQDTGWMIPSFDAAITIDRDTTVHVQETIVADFGNLIKHGIYRDIPVNYTTRYGNKLNIRFNLESVTDETGQKYATNVTRSGDEISIRIGDPDTTISGTHTYVISYSVRRVITTPNDEAELYWNVTGDSWPVPIENARATITGPSDSINKSICFTGRYGATNSDCSISETPSSVTVSTSRIEPYSGLTVAVGLDNNSLTFPTSFDKTFWFLQDNWFYLIPFFVLLVMIRLYWSKGRDKQYVNLFHESDVVRTVPLFSSLNALSTFHPPDTLTPGEVGVIVDERVNSRDITATILHLAVRGYITIKEEQKGKVFKRSEFTVILQGKDESALKKYEKAVLDLLFGTARQTETKLSKLPKDAYKYLADVQKNLYDEVTKEGYFSGNPQSVRTKYVIAGVLVGCLAFFVPPLLEPIASVTSSVVGLGLSGLIIVIFSFIMPARTAKGRKALAEVVGLREYVKVGAWRQQEYEKRNFFEETLPYTIAFGLATKFINAFKDANIPKPDWYQGTGTFRPLVLINSMDSFDSSLSKGISATRPKSASSGGSGFSGGGFSGGGFGGGGGGSW